MKHYAEVMRSLCGALCAYGRLCGTLCGGLCAQEGKCTKPNESPVMAKFSFELAWLSLVSHFHLSRPGMFGGSSVRSEQPPIHRPNKKRALRGHMLTASCARRKRLRCSFGCAEANGFLCIPARESQRPCTSFSICNERGRNTSRHAILAIQCILASNGMGGGCGGGGGGG